MNLNRILLILANLTVAGVVHAYVGLPGTPVITNPAPNRAFAPGTGLVPCGWSTATEADSYELKVLFNGRAFASQSGIPTTSVVLADSFTPGYYTLFVRGTNMAGLGPWSSNVTFIVRRRMIPDGSLFNGVAPKVFKWTRTNPATRYQVKVSMYDAVRAKYRLVQEAWVPQPATGSPKWVPAAIVPNGKFRWTVTDYKGTNRHYTQTAYFRVKNTGVTVWNDPAKVIGHWKVVSPWRWVEMTFEADGTIVNKQGDGTTFRRAKWYVEGTKFVMVSDVTEKWDYVVTDKTLALTLDGVTKNLVRMP